MQILNFIKLEEVETKSQTECLGKNAIKGRERASDKLVQTSRVLDDKLNSNTFLTIFLTTGEKIKFLLLEATILLAFN
jgi:hypothetical protein